MTLKNYNFGIRVLYSPGPSWRTRISKQYTLVIFPPKLFTVLHYSPLQSTSINGLFADDDWYGFGTGIAIVHKLTFYFNFRWTRSWCDRVQRGDEWRWPFQCTVRSIRCQWRGSCHQHLETSQHCWAKPTLGILLFHPFYMDNNKNKKFTNHSWKNNIWFFNGSKKYVSSKSD